MARLFVELGTPGSAGNELYELLVMKRGWSLEEFGEFVADLMISQTVNKTSVKQGDLLTAMFGSHGDAPKVVMAVSGLVFIATAAETAAESVEAPKAAAKAVNLVFPAASVNREAGFRPVPTRPADFRAAGRVLMFRANDGPARPAFLRPFGESPPEVFATPDAHPDACRPRGARLRRAGVRAGGGAGSLADSARAAPTRSP